MDTIWKAAVVLAALELIPGDPSDLTALLRDTRERQALLTSCGHDGGQDYSQGDRCTDSEPRRATSPLSQYLVAAIDPGRVETWAKHVERGAREMPYVPVIAGDDSYPARLEGVWDAPPVLFRSLDTAVPVSSGPLDLDAKEKALAVVGGREVVDEVLTATYSVASTVAEHGVRVVSGLAAGVDTAAHTGAVDAGGLTTAVLGTGIEHVFPSENRQLASRIQRQGVLVSQFAPPAPRTGTTFLRRNAVIAGLSDVSLIMDGRPRSGSRHEVEQAVRYGKPVLLWAPALSDESWAHSFVNAGWASFVESVEDVVTFLR